MKIFAQPAVLAGALLLQACASLPVIEPGGASPKPFLPEEALVGRLTGHGVITPIVGSSSDFDVTILGSWDGKVLTLAETFQYPSGTTEKKTWRLTKSASGDYVGTREDVIGTAHAYLDGTSMRLDYRVKLDTPLGRTARFQDILYWENEQTIRNAATVSKAGFRLARVSLRMVRTN